MSDSLTSLEPIRAAGSPDSDHAFELPITPRGKAFTGFLLPPAFVACFLFLDRLSLVDPYSALGIDAWTPSLGLAVALLLLCGKRYAPLVFIAPLISALVFRRPGVSFPLEVLLTLISGLSVLSATAFITLPRLRFDRSLARVRDVGFLLLGACIAALIESSSSIALATAVGILPQANALGAARMLWTGDFIGIVIVCSFVLVMTSQWQTLKTSRIWKNLFLPILMILIILGVFWPFAPVRWLFLLILPLVWMGLTCGMLGTVFGLVLMQVAISIGAREFGQSPNDVLLLQARMLVMAMTGLAIGALVMERRRAEEQLLRHSEALGRLGRIGSMGELAAAIAHEINQPLLAAGTYARHVEHSLREPDFDRCETAQVARKMVDQVERAANVIRNIRSLIKLERGSRQPCRIGEMIDAALTICQPGLSKKQIAHKVHLGSGLPVIMAVQLQIEQVLVNLIQNACEAAPAGKGQIVISVRLLDDDTLELTVADNGPGFPNAMLSGPPMQFWTTKEDGIGIGMALTRTIVEAHQGRLTLTNTEQGALVRVTLPISEENSHG